MGSYVSSVFPFWLGVWDCSEYLQGVFHDLQKMGLICEWQQPKVVAHSVEDGAFQIDDQCEKEDDDQR